MSQLREMRQGTLLREQVKLAKYFMKVSGKKGLTICARWR